MQCGSEHRRRGCSGYYCAKGMNIEIEPFAAVTKQLCRLCLGNQQGLIDIFHVQSEQAHSEPLIVRIHVFLQLEIIPGDNLPKWICKQCLDKIDDFTCFREQCKHNEHKLRLETGNPVQLKAGIGELFPEGVLIDEGDLSTDDEETETIVIDPAREYESSNESLPNDEYNGENGDIFLPTTGVGNESGKVVSKAEVDENDINDSLVEEVEEGEDEDEEDIKCDTFPENSRNGLPNCGSTNAIQQKMVIFTCKYCDVAFAAISACQLHEMQDHDILAPYACSFCSYKTAIRLSLIEHIREAHSISRPYICVQCNKGFPRRSDLKKHTFVHTGVRPFACDQCGKSFSRNTNLTKHMRIHSGLKPHACDICPRSFANKADLVRHQKIHSGQRSQFSCARCGNTYARKDKLYNHERICFRMLATSEAGNDPFADSLMQPSMPEFQFSLTFSPQIPDPMLKENPASAELLSDPVMGSFGGFPLPMPEHISPMPPSSKIYNCTKCPKRFLSKSSLRAHQASHSSEDSRKYECPQCRKHFVGKREFERHLMTHTDMKPFDCRACGKKFSRKDKLQRHERIHQRDRYFSCPNCDAKFQRRDALASHLKIHCTAVTGGNYSTSTAATVTAPFDTLGQEQLMPHEHSMLYMYDDDPTAIDSVRL